MASNGLIHKNKIIPVKLSEEERIETAKGGTAENPSAMNTDVKESPGIQKKVRIVPPIRAVAKTKVNVSRWRKYARRRGDMKNWKEFQKARIDFPTIRESMKLKDHGMNAAQMSDLEEFVEITSNTEKLRNDSGVNTLTSPSRALLYYFAKLASSNREEEVIDLEFIDTLIESGASANTADRHGQTLLHEAARQWESTVAKLLLDRGKEISRDFSLYKKRKRLNR